MNDSNRPDGEDQEPRPFARVSARAPHRRRTPWGTVEGRVISVISRKGGVGKTTSAVNLGAALALSGHTVLIIGTDPQCGVCRTLGLGPDHLEVRLLELFHGIGNLLDLANTTPIDGLHFISPGITTLLEEEDYLEQLVQRSDDFAAAVDQARISFDTILIDCPPSLGPAARAALLASDSFLVPVQAEELCRESLADLLAFVDDFRDRHFGGEAGFLDLPTDRDFDDDPPQPLELEGLFLTMASDHTRMGQHVSAKVREEFGPLLFSTAIPRTTRLSEMALKGKPTVIFDRRSKGSRAYFDLADELVERYRLRAGDDDEELAEEDTFISGAAGDEDADAAAAAAELDMTMEACSGGGLGRFLAALGGAPAVAGTIPAFDEPSVPEMVSLDELLAEEEAGQGEGYDDWDEGIWPQRHHRLN